MLSNLINNIITFFSKKSLLFVFILLAILTVFGFGILKININESIFSMLPKGNSFSKFSKLIDQGELTNQVVFTLNVADVESDEITKLTSVLSDSLNAYAEVYLKDITIERPDVQTKIFDYFYNNFPAFINEEYYKTIENKIKGDSVVIHLSNAQRNLLSPGGFMLREFILKDPISISGDFFKELNENNNLSNLNVDNGFLFTEDKSEILITAKTTFDASDNKKNIELYNSLNRLKKNWNELYPKNHFGYFGTFQIGAENGIQVKKDTFLTLIITLIIILLILFVFYRKILIPLYFMLPLIFGGAFALGMMGYFKSEISGISIATGAVVFGIILDYSFHFFTHLQHTNSIPKTIKEITSPLLTGGFTTIMAFAALQFTNSKVLQDFGLFAALSLTGAAFFTLTGLPIILNLFRFKYARTNKSKGLNINIPNKYRKAFVLVVALLTVGFLYFASDVQFDGNLDNLSFHSQSLKEQENKLMGINPEKEKKLYLFAEADDYEKANRSNFNLYTKIKEYESKGKIKSSFSTSQFIIPKQVTEYRNKVWKAFWKNHQESFLKGFNQSSDSLGFNESAFVDFKDWIANTAEYPENSVLYAELGLTDFINQSESKTTFITTVIVKKELVNEVQMELTEISGVSAFNRAEVATDLLTTVKNDFNFILLVSSLLVFISLLIIYGRIEMALFTFIPMVISWVWILGIAGIFDLKFNFVNIVIATFIFGLGDDFSIFVTDGLLHKYKHKKNTLGSYNMAIVLSALTTMVGTGVLFFAKHPAIHSVSVISVLGILCVLLVSIIVQPFLFDLFVQNRIGKKKTPLTLVALLVSVFEFSFFVAGCLHAYIILVGLYIFPAPKKNKRYFLNSVLSYSSWFIMFTAFHIKKRVNVDHLDLTKPSIIITNHTSFLDILMVLLVNPKIIIIVKDWVYKSVLFGPLVRYAGYIYIGNSPEENLKLIESRIKDGYSIMIFPEGSRSKDDNIRRFHKGAFFIAKELNLDITPLLLHGASYVLPKTEYFVKTGSINLKFLPRISADDLSWGETFGQRTKSISKYFKAEYLKYKDEQENAKVLFPRIFSNYIYKGPFLEWYLKIKWRFESKNYEHYNELLKGKEKVIDVGCGYGYLSYYLHYKNENREVLGLDYDEDKISIANNGFDKTSNLSFEAVDITNYNFKQFDAIILNDVLHYFSKEKQQKLLEKSARSLTEDGIILIRDGITDFKERHKKTQQTERYSTKLLGFNKKEEQFHFFSSEYIRNFAKQYNLSVQKEEQSSKTSNVLFILKKQ
jgi:1-acyl-sn-glycerol-3-phosphate acyltransferase